MSVGEIIRKKGSEVLTVLPETSVVNVARLMCDRRVGLIVVVNEGGRVLGVMSERDIVRAVAIDQDQISNLAVEDLYTRDALSCLPSDDARDAMLIMHEGRFRHMPVVEHGNLKGVVSIGDILEYIKDQSEQGTGVEVWEELNFL